MVLQAPELKEVRCQLTRSRQELARERQEAKQSRPALTKTEFVRQNLDWVDGEPSDDLIRQKLDCLEQGEKLLAVN